MESSIGLLEHEVTQQPESQDIGEPVQADSEDTAHEKPRPFLGRVKSLLLRRQEPDRVHEKHLASDAEEAALDIELTDEEEEYIEDQKKNATFLVACVRRAREAKPETFGMWIGAGLGFLGMMTDTPIPPDLASKTSVVLGLGSFGASRGKTVRQRMQYAALGATAGLAVSEGVNQFTDSGAIEFAAGLIDDASAAAGFVGAAAKGISGRLRTQPPETVIAPIPA